MQHTGASIGHCMRHIRSNLHDSAKWLVSSAYSSRIIQDATQQNDMPHQWQFDGAVTQ